MKSIYENNGFKFIISNNYDKIICIVNDITLLLELRNSTKRLINLQKKDNECFRWCHIRYLNPLDREPHKIKKTDRTSVNTLD